MKRLLVGVLALMGCARIGFSPSGHGPERTNPRPTTASVVTDAEVLLSIDTDRAARCRYGTLKDVAFSAQPEAMNAVTPTHHEALVTGLVDATGYSYYVRCRDDDGNTDKDDLVIAFTTDLRPRAYRSVGPGSMMALASGEGLVVTGTLGRFAEGLPARVGIGDVVQYDSDDDGVPDALATITRRTDALTYALRDPSGAPPVAVDNATFSVFRAYLSLDAATRGEENPAIRAALRDFDTFDADVSLVTLNRVWDIVCYGDAVDTHSVELLGWETNVSHPLRIYTPVRPDEVGESQRHDGVWRDGAYTLRGDDTRGIYAQAAYLSVEGLQIEALGKDEGTEGISIKMTGPGVVTIGGNIIRGGGAGKGDIHVGVNFSISAPTSELRLVNNMIYGFRGTAEVEYAGWGAMNGPLYAVNNTVADSAVGFYYHVIAVNNVFYDVDEPLEYLIDSASHHNATNALEWPAVVDASNRTSVAFSFASAVTDDYRLSPTDQGARDHGSSDVASFTSVDIQGQPRGETWDLGADEYVP